VEGNIKDISQRYSDGLRINCEVERGIMIGGEYSKLI